MIKAKSGIYQYGQCVGKGSTCSVYRCLNRNSGETVAIKYVNTSEIPHQELQMIMYEIDLLKQLRHINIVELKGSQFDAEGKLEIVMEYFND